MKDVYKLKCNAASGQFCVWRRDLKRRFPNSKVLQRNYCPWCGEFAGGGN